MSTRMRAFLANGLGELRYEPIGKRIRAVLGDETAVDTTEAVLVREPRRIVPSYAVPADDVLGELPPAGAAGAGDTGETGVAMPSLSGRPVRDPSVPFAVPRRRSTRSAVLDSRGSISGSNRGAVSSSIHRIGWPARPGSLLASRAGQQLALRGDLDTGIARADHDERTTGPALLRVGGHGRQSSWRVMWSRR